MALIPFGFAGTVAGHDEDLRAMFRRSYEMQERRHPRWPTS